MHSIAALTHVLGSEKIGARHVRLLAVITLIMMMDGVDLQLLALTTPLIVDEWSITPATMAPALTAALIGMAAGTVVGGWLGDRFGRRPVIIGSALLFGVLTLATSQATGVTSLTAIRLVAGLGFGALTPNIYALSGEVFPTALRARVMGLLSIGIPLGGVAGSGLTLLLVDSIGWRGLFVLVGAASLAVVVLAWGLVPESPSFLVISGHPGRAMHMMHRITNRDQDTLSIELAEFTHSQNEIDERRPADPALIADDTGGLFGPASRRLTIGASVTFFALFFITYAFINWQPTLLKTAGLPLDTVLQASLALSTLTTIGGLLVSIGLDRVGSRPTILVGAAVTAVVLVTFPFVVDGAAGGTRLFVTALMVGTGTVGFVLGYVGATLYASVAIAYPVRYRARGVGFTASVARCAGIVVTFIGGLLLAASSGGQVFFWVLAVMAIIMMVGSLVNDRHLKPIRKLLPKSPTRVESH